jgi:hypothetical protein
VRKLGIGFTLLLLISILPAYSSSPPKSGSVCAKQGVTKIFQGRSYTCIKSKGKQIWSKGKIIKTAAPIPTPTVSPTAQMTQTPTPAIPVPSVSPSPTSTQNSGSSGSTPTGIKQKTSLVTYEPPNLQSEDIELCKIKQLGNHGTKSGFPAPTALYQGKGEVTWALIPIDFSDLPGESNFMTRAKSEMDFASDWAENSSEGQLKIKWRVQENWIRMPGLSKDYAVPKSDNQGFGSPNQQSIWTKVITEVDKSFDFKGIQAVQFILPAGQSIIEYGIKGNIGFDVVKNYVTGEGTRIDLFSIPSTFNEEPKSGRNFWSWWMYHYMVGIGVGKFGGSNTPSEFHTYLIQGTTEGARELGGWIRFLVGWMPDSRVYCKSPANLSTLDLTLIPLTDNTKQGIKLAVLPLSPSKALILESRRVTKFSCTTNTERNGVLVYLYDSTLGHLDEYFTAISPSGRPNESYSCFASQSRDLLLHEGDRVTYEGITIEVLAHGEFDRVRVTRNP